MVVDLWYGEQASNGEFQYQQMEELYIGAGLTKKYLPMLVSTTLYVIMILQNITITQSLFSLFLFWSVQPLGHFLHLSKCELREFSNIFAS